MKTAELTIRQAILSARKTLEAVGIDEADLNADYLAAHLLNTDKGRLPLYWHDIADNSFISAYSKLIERRSNREPLQYITESWDFFDLTLRTTGVALIPRADTESLVLAIIELTNFSHNQPQFFVDVCTGSGAIGLALAKKWPSSNGLLLDVCPDAIRLSRLNAQRNQLNNVTCLLSDMLTAVRRESVELVISNPPYIPTEDINGLMPEVRDHEPTLALDGGKDGLDFIKTLIKQALLVLKPGGILAFEHGYNQQQSAVNLLSSDWKLLQTGQDLCHNDRFIICKKEQEESL